MPELKTEERRETPTLEPTLFFKDTLSPGWGPRLPDLAGGNQPTAGCGAGGDMTSLSNSNHSMVL